MREYNQFSYNLINSYKKHRDAINIFLLITVSICAFYNSLNGYFLVDDFYYAGHRIRDISNIFITNTYGSSTGGNYRPIEVLSHMFDTYLYGENYIPSRNLTNLIVHIFNVIIVYIIAFYLTQKKVIGLVAGLLFAVHPIHSQPLPPVAWISGRTDILVSFFYLLTFLLFIIFLIKKSYSSYLISFATFILALMSKEMAITLPFVILLYMLLFPSPQERGKASSLIWWTILLGGILLIIFGIIFNPNFITNYISSDGVLEQSSIKKIHFLQFSTIISGFILILAAVFLKLSKKASKLLLSIPYFVILFSYFIVRFLVLSGIGGAYKAADKKTLISQVGVDTFMRDIFSLLGLVISAGDAYYIDIFKLQIDHQFIFFAISISIVIILALILLKLITQSKELTFCYLWIFITLIPVHNIVITSWVYHSRYLYLASVGFCMFISILLYKLTQAKNTSSHLAKVVIPAFVLFIVSLNSILIIKHNEKIVKSGDIMQEFVSDIKRYQSKISDTTNLYFITFPLSPIDNRNNVWISAFMNDVLNFAFNKNKHWEKYNYAHLLFIGGEESNEVNINWLNERIFLIDNISHINHFLIPKELSSMEQQIKGIYKHLPPYPMLQALPHEKETIETKDAIITVLDVNKDYNKAKLEVELKDPLNNASNTLFFVYAKGHFHLVKEFSNRRIK